jgi:hypothetical protein
MLSLYGPFHGYAPVLGHVELDQGAGVEVQDQGFDLPRPPLNAGPL